MNKYFKHLVTSLIVIILSTMITACSGKHGDYYYTQIDNTKISENEKTDGGVVNFSGNMDYKYKLTSYDSEGNEKEVTFGTSRMLKEGAFLRLKVVPIRGVTEWKEVQYDDLPEKIQKKYEL